MTQGQLQDFFILICEEEEQQSVTYFEINETKIILSLFVEIGNPLDTKLLSHIKYVYCYLKHKFYS